MPRICMKPLDFMTMECTVGPVCILMRLPLKKAWLDIDREVREGDIVRLYMEAEFVGMGEIQADGSAKFKAMLWTGGQE